MRVETIVNITGGELLNNPIINSFNNIKVDTSIIERGDLFFAYNQNDIPKAIKKGAYGVIIDRYIEILDKEIAWIRVNNLDEAIFSILKSMTLNSNKKFLLCDDITFLILKKLQPPKKFFLVDNPFNMALGLNKNLYPIIICSKSYILDKIKADYSIMDNESQNITIINQGLFNVEYIIKNRRFSSILPSIFIRNLKLAIGFLEEKNIDTKFEYLDMLDIFEPIFVDNKYHKKEFGKTSKVVLLSKFYTIDIIKKLYNYQISNSIWANNIFFIQKTVDSSIIENAIYFEDTESLKRILYEQKDNFIYIFYNNINKNGVFNDDLHKRDSATLF
jgi:ferrochelatase